MAKKSLFRVAKRVEIVAKELELAVFYWQNADTFAEIVAKTQVMICYQKRDYSNT